MVQSLIHDTESEQTKALMVSRSRTVAVAKKCRSDGQVVSLTDCSVQWRVFEADS